MVRQLTIACVGILGLACTGLCTEPNTVWIEEFNVAKQAARQQGKDLLILFTGSDWCPWCKRLEAEVLSQEAFKNQIPKGFVLVKLDFPRTKDQPVAVKKQNEQLKATFEEKYKFGGYPNIYLADANGIPYVQMGYEEGGADKYLQYLSFLRKARNMVDPGSEWIEDFQVALAKADYLQKDLLMLFTGSDWCPYCTRLDNQVLSKDVFRKGASKEFIFVKLDYPRTRPQDPRIKAQNQMLNNLFTSKFDLQGFPTIYLADPKGIPYAQTGLSDMDAKQYAQHLHKLRGDHLKAGYKVRNDPNSPAR